MKKYNLFLHRTIATALIFALCILTFALAGCSAGNSGSSKNVTLKFAIWDSTQKDGMEQIAKKFESKNPNIHVKVEVTPWDQYWPKMQAAGSGSSMPDVLWMHPDDVYTFAEGGKIMDLTSETNGKIDLNKFPKNINANFNIGGKQYAIAKDYSTFGLWYNKALFDEKGISYPNDTWTWDTLKTVAAKITDKSKGIYGFLAENSAQNCYYQFIWQNGGDIINSTDTKSLYDDAKTIGAMDYIADFVKKGYSPTPSQFANTNAAKYFESGKGAMLIAGSWNCNEFTTTSGLKCDVAPLPKGTQRASLCGGMGYSVSASTKHPTEAIKFLEYISGQEANDIQASSGAAIPAYDGTQQGWVSKFPGIKAQVFVDASKYGHSSQYCESHSNWSDDENTITNKILSGELSAEDGCKQLAQKVNDTLKK